jgi:hypothetical protein
MNLYAQSSDPVGLVRRGGQKKQTNANKRRNKHTVIKEFIN